MTVDSIQNGIVIDHIKAGCALRIYDMLHFAELSCPVAMMTNVHSNKMGKKDIIKIDGDLSPDLAVIGYVSPGATVNIIQDGRRVDKYTVAPPLSITNVITCQNARCITTTERDIPHIFLLVNRDKCEYRCKYCEFLAK